MTSSGPPKRRLDIDIVVHGRFHAFHLARALIARGHDVRLLTNYPAWAVKRFGIPAGAVRSFVTHGVLLRVQDRLLGRRGIKFGQPALHHLFGAWAARSVRADCDLVYIFSGVAEETLQRFAGCARPRIWLTRGSTHIRTQYDLLAAEEERTNTRQDKPSAWSIAREEREYALAPYIVTLSTFSLRSFTERPSVAGKAFMLMSAVDAKRFRADETVLQERLRRIRGGEPLRVLNVGAFSFRKGAIDLADVARSLAGRMHFRFVGDMPEETSQLRSATSEVIEFVPRVPEPELVRYYAAADIFLFPTIEDGFPAVVAQAQASGLPVITTPNGSGPDILTEEADGWIVPIRSSAAIAAILDACDRDRQMLARVVEASACARKSRDWSAMAAGLEAEYARQISANHG